MNSKKKKGNLSKYFFYIKDLVRIIQPSDKKQQVWSHKIYKIEKVYKPLKFYTISRRPLPKYSKYGVF